MDFDNLKEEINKLILMQEDIVKLIENEINYIIENKIKDDKKVEKLFEQLLNLFQTDEIFNLYKKLCNYYYNINKNLVINYCDIYEEMYLEENEKILKK